MTYQRIRIPSPSPKPQSREKKSLFTPQPQPQPPVNQVPPKQDDPAKPEAIQEGSSLLNFINPSPSVFPPKKPQVQMKLSLEEKNQQPSQETTAKEVTPKENKNAPQSTTGLAVNSLTSEFGQAAYRFWQEPGNKN